MLVIVVMILLNSTVYDFWTGPRASELIKHNPQSPERKKYHGVDVMLILLAVMLVSESFKKNRALCF